MDAYSKILVGNQLYSLETIEQFGKRHPKWYTMSGREKESHMLHVTLCMLLCNREQVVKEKVPGKAKRIQPPAKERPSKIAKYSPSVPGTSKDHDPVYEMETCSSTSTKSSTTTEDEMAMESTTQEEIQNYRFQMINHMPLKDATIKDICKEWGVGDLSYQWDIVDLEEKKLVRVRYSYNIGSDMHKYLRAKTEIPNNSDMFIIEAGKTTGKWIDNNKKAQGEGKITKFLIERELILSSHNIKDNLYLAPVEIETIFPSEWLREELSKWEDCLLSTQNDKYSEKELYKNEKPPKAITPSDFLDNLLHLQESEESNECIKWNGKLLPEPMCLNVHLRENKDAEMISAVLSHLKGELTEGYSVHKMNMKLNSVLNPQVIFDLISIWEDSDKNTFSFLERCNTNLSENIRKSLGIGKKGVKHSEFKEDMKQPEYSENLRLKYNAWIEEVFTGMAESTNMPLGYLPCSELMVSSPTDGHPIPILCEPIASEMFREMLNTNMGIQVSKLTNTYSRLGGAYHSEAIYGKEMFKNVAIFPIVASLSSKDYSEESHISSDWMRLVSGVVVRAPYHARRPTDKIMILTIEMVEKTQKNFNLLKFVKNCIVLEASKCLIAIRQNAVMKEDSTYNTFITTALFTPINMLGCMTLENPNVLRNENMENLMKETMDRGSKWYTERAIEGVMFAMIGNSRDEGYFAYLRKIFLVIMAWRREKAAASLDIVSFCKKANECLIDNPISMYFHNTLLWILQIYKNRGQRMNAI